VAGAFVVAFTDFEGKVGAQGTSDSRGRVKLALGASRAKIERVYVYPEIGYWGLLQRSFVLTSGTEFAVTPIDLRYTDSLRHFVRKARDPAGSGVTVAVIDTGVDSSHPDLTVQGGENTVPGESPVDFGDNGEHHGTHVAGIIAAHGTPPSGIRGVAPSVSLRSYRVFGKGKKRATNYAISKAVDRAAADGCDLLNMSLGGGDPDEATEAALEDARALGALPIVASGNDSRGPVAFPASGSFALAVSAMGRKGTFPPGSTQVGDAKSPYGRDRKNFVASFSNIGPEIDLTAPGVGIISTVPGGYGVMDGTSMACPAAVGMAARLLAARPDILGMPRDQARSDAMAQVIMDSGVLFGFGATYEGHGFPRPR
jgi:subtilisin